MNSSLDDFKGRFQSVHEGEIKRNLQESKNSDGKESLGVNNTRSPSVLQVNDQNYRRREGQHRHRHGEEEESEGHDELAGESKAEIPELERGGENGEEHDDGSQGAGEREYVHYGEYQEERVVQEDGNSGVLVGASRDGVCGGEGHGGDEDRYG